MMRGGGWLATVWRLPPRAYGQMLRRWWRQRGVARRWPPTLQKAVGGRLAAALGAPEKPVYELLYDFWQRPVRRFFVSQARARGQALAEAYPLLRVERLVLAEQAVKHEFDLLGSGLAFWGDPLRWTWDPGSGFEWTKAGAPLVKLNAGRDIKVPWELGRMQHWVVLGQAYALTGDVRYVQTLVAQFSDWYDRYPPGVGIHWASAMEVAIRAVNLTWAYELVLDDKDHANESFTIAYLDSLLWHGRYIEDHLEDYYPPNNHLLANYCGLVWLGVYLRPAPEAARWLKLGLDGLAAALVEQVLTDGVSYESSTNYHWLNCEMLVWTLALCDLNGVPVAPKIRETVTAMCAALHGLVLADGKLPLFGDHDSGRWLALGPASVADTLTLAAAVLQQPQWAARNVKQAPSVLWAGLKPPDKGQSPPRKAVQVWSAAGWGVLRGTLAGQPLHLAVTAGEVYPRRWGGHAHNDGLSFEVVWAGRRVLVDAGTLHYTRQMATRNAFRSVVAHNTLQVGEQEPHGLPADNPFALDVRGQAGPLKQGADWIEGRFDWRKPKATHTRRWVWVQAAEQWLVADRVEGKGTQSLVWRFRAGPGVTVTVNGLVAHFTTPEGQALVLKPAGDTDGMAATVADGQYCPAYGLAQAIEVLEYRQVATLPLAVSFQLRSLASPDDGAVNTD